MLYYYSWKVDVYDTRTDTFIGGAGGTSMPVRAVSRRHALNKAVAAVMKRPCYADMQSVWYTRLTAEVNLEGSP